MQESTYRDLSRHEDTLWRSVANREMVVSFWKKYRRDQPSYVALDAGCGPGALAEFLGQESTSFGMDPSRLALELAAGRGLRKIFFGDLTAVPAQEGTFDLVTAIDVIEHVSDDLGAVRELYRVLKKDGLLISVIPAFNFLWSERDERLGHKKRYTVGEVRELMQKSGLTVLKCSYINLFYFLPFWALVSWRKIFHPVPRIGTDVPAFPGFINKTLLALLRAETWLLSRSNFPLGVSTLCVAQK